MAELLPPAKRQRLMVFVPDAVPHFVLVCRERTGWSIRDFSSGRSVLLATTTFNAPIDQILAERRAVIFPAPRVATSDSGFWKRLTEELGQRFIGYLGACGQQPGSTLYPVLGQPPPGLTPFEQEHLTHGPRSIDWTTWNAMHLLRTERPQTWWTDLASRADPLGVFNGIPEVAFWKSIEHRRWNVRVDLHLDAGKWLVLGHSNPRSIPKLKPLIHLADCLVAQARGRACALWILTDSRAANGLEYEVERYRQSPEMFAAELPHHPASILYELANRLAVVRWHEVLAGLLSRRVADEPAVAAVRKELRRRVQGMTIAAGA